jgi:hypothetical protein
MCGAVLRSNRQLRRRGGSARVREIRIKGDYPVITGYQAVSPAALRIAMNLKRHSSIAEHPTLYNDAATGNRR